MFLGQEVDDQVANLIISQMLFLEAQHNERDIFLYINSPGGAAYAGMAIYDVMQHVEPDVSTICVGMGMSAAAIILSGGAAGKRFALPNARIMIHQGSAGTGARRRTWRSLRRCSRHPPHVRDHRPSLGATGRTGGPGHRPGPLHVGREARDYGLIDDIILPAAACVPRTGSPIPNCRRPAGEPRLSRRARRPLPSLGGPPPR